MRSIWKDMINDCSHMKQVLRKPYSESSDSLDGLFGDDKDTSCSPNIAGVICPKEVHLEWRLCYCYALLLWIYWVFVFCGNGSRYIHSLSVFVKFLNCLSYLRFGLIPKPMQEPDILDGGNDDRRASLLMMNFSVDKVDFAMNKLGMQIFLLEEFFLFACLWLCVSMGLPYDVFGNPWPNEISHRANQDPPYHIDLHIFALPFDQINLWRFMSHANLIVTVLPSVNFHKCVNDTCFPYNCFVALWTSCVDFRWLYNCTAGAHIWTRSHISMHIPPQKETYDLCPSI